MLNNFSEIRVYLKDDHLKEREDVCNQNDIELATHTYSCCQGSCVGELYSPGL
jgi:hypothetical protein